MAKTFRGIDVSAWQGKIDFQKVKQSGIDFVIIRAGYGKVASQKDPYFETNYKNAKAAGLQVGAYWYSYASSIAEAKEEAAVCLSILKGKQFEYPIYFDLEEPKQFAQGKSFCSQLVYTFCNALEKAGYFAGFYISRSPLQTHISAEVAKRYALWVAEYGPKCNYSGTYGIWQYSSSGKVPGISGNTDMDTSYVDYPSIIKSGGYNGFKKSSATTTTVKPATPKSAPSTQKAYTKGSKITLKNATLYASSDSVSGSKISGTYYVYDGKAVNGRYRITNAKVNCGKTPISQYVTGWVKETDM